jgi:ribosomal-protein-alanine N-acetyltransferase
MNIREEDLTLREIQSADIPAILVIEEELFSDPWSAEVFLEEIESKNLFTKLVQGKERFCKHNYLLEYKGEVVGFFLAWAIHDEYSIMNIGVTKRQQRKGFGTYLLTKLIEMAIDFECLTIYLEVRAGNKSAINLYQKFYFQEIGRRKNYYSSPVEDALVMRLDLGIEGKR